MAYLRAKPMNKITFVASKLVSPIGDLNEIKDIIESLEISDQEKIYNMACNNEIFMSDNPKLLYLLSRYFEYNLKDKENADLYLKQSADSGYLNALYSLANRMYRTKPDEAIQMYNICVSNVMDSTYATLRLQEYYENRDINKYLEYLLIGQRNEFNTYVKSQSLYKLGKYYHNTDIIKAIEYYKEGCEYKNIDATIKIIEYYIQKDCIVNTYKFVDKLCDMMIEQNQDAVRINYKSDEQYLTICEYIGTKIKSAYLINDIAYYHFSNGDNIKSINYNYKALEYSAGYSIAMYHICDALHVLRYDKYQTNRFKNYLFSIANIYVLAKFLLGWFSLVDGNLDLAIKYYSESGNNGMAYGAISAGVIYQRIGEFMKAEQLYLDFLGKNPNCKEILYHLGCYYFCVNDIPNSQKYFLKCMEIERYECYIHHSSHLYTSLVGYCDEDEYNEIIFTLIEKVYGINKNISIKLLNRKWCVWENKEIYECDICNNNVNSIIKPKCCGKLYCVGCYLRNYECQKICAFCRKCFFGPDN